jgi:hypothetical protein
LNHNDKLGGPQAMNSPRLLDRHLLKNGLTLELWDHSRPVAGDRWFVCLAARIAVPVQAETLPPELIAHAAAVLEALGEEIIFTHREERNFIAASEAPILLQDMQDRILTLAPGYFGRPDFPGRFIRIKYGEKQALQQWQQRDTRTGEGS